MTRTRAQWADLLLRANGCIDLLDAAGQAGTRRWLFSVSFGLLGVLLWASWRRWRWHPGALHLATLSVGLLLAVLVMLELLFGTANP